MLKRYIYEIHSITDRIFYLYNRKMLWEKFRFKKPQKKKSKFKTIENSNLNSRK